MIVGTGEIKTLLLYWLNFCLTECGKTRKLASPACKQSHFAKSFIPQRRGRPFEETDGGGTAILR